MDNNIHPANNLSTSLSLQLTTHGENTSSVPPLPEIKSFYPSRTPPPANPVIFLPNHPHSSSSKPSRQSRFTKQEDFVTMCEVDAPGAHLAVFNETRKRFAGFAAAVNAKFLARKNVNWVGIQDRYKRLQTDFDRNDNRNQRMSNVGREVEEAEELLMEMREPRDDADAGAERSNKKVAEDEKDRIEKENFKDSLKRREESESGAESDVEQGSSRNKCKVKTSTRDIGGDRDMELFVEHMKDANLARVALDRERLAFEREKHAKEMEERERGQSERSNMREDSQKLELEKLKLMMDVFAKRP